MKARIVYEISLSRLKDALSYYWKCHDVCETGCDTNFNGVVFLDTINVINVKLCMKFTLIKALEVHFTSKPVSYI